MMLLLTKKMMPTLQQMSTWPPDLNLCHHCRYRYHPERVELKVIQNIESQLLHWPVDDISFAHHDHEDSCHMAMEACYCYCCVVSCAILNSQTSLLSRCSDSDWCRLNNLTALRLLVVRQQLLSCRC